MRESRPPVLLRALLLLLLLLFRLNTLNSPSLPVVESVTPVCAVRADEREDFLVELETERLKGLGGGEGHALGTFGRAGGGVSRRGGGGRVHTFPAVPRARTCACASPGT